MNTSSPSTLGEPSGPPLVPPPLVPPPLVPPPRVSLPEEESLPSSSPSREVSSWRARCSLSSEPPVRERCRKRQGRGCTRVLQLLSALHVLPLLPVEAERGGGGESVEEAEA